MSKEEEPALSIDLFDRIWLLESSTKQLQAAPVLITHGEWDRVIEMLVEIRASGKPTGFPSLSTLATQALEFCQSKDEAATMEVLETLAKKVASLLRKEQKELGD